MLISGILTVLVGYGYGYGYGYGSGFGVAKINKPDIPEECSN
jgi:hypothetical protein